MITSTDGRFFSDILCSQPNPSALYSFQIIITIPPINGGPVLLHIMICKAGSVISDSLVGSSLSSYPPELNEELNIGCTFLVIADIRNMQARRGNNPENTNIDYVCDLCHNVVSCRVYLCKWRETWRQRTLLAFLSLPFITLLSASIY